MHESQSPIELTLSEAEASKITIGDDRKLC